MKTKKAVSTTLLTVANLAMAGVVYAANGVQNVDIGIGPDGNLLDWVKKLLNYVITLAGLVSAGILIFSGYQYITANGDQAKVDKAVKSLTGAIIGLVICFISTLIVNFVLNQVISGER